MSDAVASESRILVGWVFYWFPFEYLAHRFCVCSSKFDDGVVFVSHSRQGIGPTTSQKMKDDRFCLVVCCVSRKDIIGERSKAG